MKKFLNKQDKLLDMSLEWDISKENYLRKNNEIEEEIRELKDRKNNIKNDDFLKKTHSWLELFLDSKKELHIAENPLLESSKIFNFYFGTPKGNWTPVSALRGPCPSH